MGPLFVFMFYIVAMAILSLPCIALGIWLANRVTRSSTNKIRNRFRIAAVYIPLCGALYVLICIIAIGVFGELTNRDLGFGDDFEVPLHNGYHWSAIDEPIAACVYPGSSEDMSHFCGLPNFNPNVFVDVAALQERGDWLAGAFDSNEGHFLYPEQQRADRWFLFNTKTHQRYDTADEAALATLTAQHGFALKLESSSDFYEHHRYRWYDAAFVLLLLAPPFVVLLWLYKKARRLLREAAETAGPDVVETT